MTEAYGAFFLLRGRLVNGLLLLATLVDPMTGLGGLVGLLGVEAARRLGLSGRHDDLDRINGLLLGLVMGATFSSWFLLLLSGPVAAAFTRCLAPEIEHRGGLPLLALPFALGGFFLWSVASVLLVPRAVPQPLVFSLGEPAVLRGWLSALGGVYLAPYPLSGLLVGMALMLRSRYLAFLTLVGFGCSEATLAIAGAWRGGPTSMVAGTGAIVAAVLVGGLMCSPSPRSLGLGALSAGAATLAYLGLVGPLARLGIVPLALPFILAVWLALRGWGHCSGLGWLTQPELPEASSEKAQLARARGQSGSLALEAPFEGRWAVYQGVDGPHTHRDKWTFALDFVQTIRDHSFCGSGNQVGDFYAFGRRILSPVTGVVVECSDDRPDNPPGGVDLDQKFGNYVLLDIGGGLYVLLAHLQQDSLVVKRGESVVAGQWLGGCGNSGRSPQPHLHLHVQRGRPLGSPTVPFHLTGVLYQGDYTLRCTPGEGDVVERPRVDQDLSQAVSMEVGERFLYCCEGEAQVGNRMASLAVELDLQGVFWLASEQKARVAFHQSSSALAFFWRDHTADPLLDTLTLALGVTPLCDGPTRWTEATPLRLMGRRGSLFSALGHSEFRRERSSREEWLQFGEHRARPGGEILWQTRAVFSREGGVSEVILWKEGRTVLRARLVGRGLKGDLGIPGWLQPCGQTSRDLPSGELHSHT